MRLNIGCGSVQPDHWVNADVAPETTDPWCGVWYADLKGTLPFGDEDFDVIVANHVLSDLTWHEVPHALDELRRVLVAGGVLRILVPDILRAFAAREAGYSPLFPIDADVPTLDEKFCAFLVWFGTVRSVWTPNALGAVLYRAGFAQVVDVPHGETFSKDPHITDLDDREGHSFVMEAMR